MCGVYIYIYIYIYGKWNKETPKDDADFDLGTVYACNLSTVDILLILQPMHILICI